MHFSALTTVAFSALAAAKDIPITVGANGAFAFDPSDIKADVNDTLIFSFFPINHAVATADFNNPCMPSSGDGGFYSDFQPTSDTPSNQTFEVIIQDTKPIWFYCPQTTGSHCQSGMVGVVNAPANKTLDQFKAAAAQAPPSVAPPTAFGGTLVVANSSSSSDGSSSSGSSSSSNSTLNNSGNANSTSTGSGPVPSSGAATLGNMAPVALAVGLFVALLS